MGPFIAVSEMLNNLICSLAHQMEHHWNTTSEPPWVSVEAWRRHFSMTVTSLSEPWLTLEQPKTPNNSKQKYSIHFVCKKMLI